MADSDYSEDIETLIGQPKISRASPRPKSARKSSKKGKSGSSPYGVSSSTKTAHELWTTAVKGSGASIGAKKRTPTASWNETLKKTGVGFTDTNKMSSFSGLKKGQMKNMSYASTSTYLKHLAGGDAATPRKSTDGAVRASAGRPAYKSQEEYYDEVIALKKQIQDLNSNNSTLKLKIRRMEEDNLKKEKQIEELLDPSKSDEMRRTLSEKRPDSSTVIHGLKQKVLKLEHQLKERESAYHKLQSDLKSTKVEELKAQMECFYKEIMRLNQVKSVTPSQAHQTKSGSQVKETPSRLKALQETIMRMNEKNVRLTAENKALKEDLGQVMEDKAEAKDKQREYEDMSKKELLNSISKLEKRLDKAEEGMSITSDIETRGSKIEGKVKLEGTMAQKLSQLDQRETELLEELNKQKGITKKLKEDRVHYRKKCEEKDKDIKALKKDIDDLEKELDQFYDQDKSRTPRVSPRRPRSSERRQSERADRDRKSDKRERSIERERSFDRKSSRASSLSSGDKERLRKAERMRENHAARTIQRGWRKHHEEAEESADEERIRAEKLKAFSEQRAARRIQRGWIDLQARKLAQEQEETAEFLQSALRGHSYRKKNMSYMRNRHDSPDDMEGSEDDTAEYIQSSYRAHKFRNDQIKSRSRSSSPRSKRAYGRLDSEGEEYDDDYVNRRKGTSRTSPRAGRSSMSRKSPRHVLDTDEEDESDDDDLVVSHSKFR